MLKPMIVGLILLGAASTATASGQTHRYVVTIAPTGSERGFRKPSVSKAAIGGSTVRLWGNTAINPDCSAQAPGATLAIVTPASHGAATISDEPYYFGLPPENPRSACNNRKIPGHQAFYTATDGFSGYDRVGPRGTSPEGRVRQITVDIEVR